MGKRLTDEQRCEKADAASPLEGLEAPVEPADPMILKIVERMVEMRRQRLEERRRPRTGKKTARKRKTSTPT